VRLAALLGVVAAVFLFQGGTHVRALNCHANDAWQDRFPSWSPTENTIAFIRQQPGCDPPAESLGFVAPGRPEVTWGADAMRGSWAPPSWQPGGFLVEYGRDRGTVGETAPDGPLGDGGPGLYPSRAGDRIAVTVGSSLQIMDVGPTGGGRRVLVPAYLKPSQSTGVAAWSPDHTRLAFGVELNCCSAVEGGIAVVNADGSDFRVVARGPNQSVNPTWSPDGQTIAFETSRNRDFEIYSVRADGTQLRNLTNTPEAEDRMPAWSGNAIAFISNRDRAQRDLYGYGLYTMSPDGSNLRERTFDLHPNSPLAWSPDGTKIAFAAGRECLRWGIYVLDFAAGTVQRVTNRCFVSGTGHADVLAGTNFRDIVNGLSGADRIFGLGGDDLLHGGRGKDRVLGGAGRDTLYGDPGADRISCGTGRDTVYVDKYDRVARDCELVYPDRTK
jgi:RTX calcium-binding nonapeptide repeat (4 copies)/WD40-like Beta Propeller Repeat